MLNLYDLTVDYQKEPKLTPLTGLRFGWKLSSDKQNVIQKTARILVCDGGTVIGDTGIIESNRNFDICPMLPTLEPMKEYSFTVEVTDNQGESAKASLAFITAPTEEDWQGAEWIRPARHI
ncbi:MAG: hypothetical protein MJ175_07930, partial [Clostridia bacterium]|nr:hypothetical protein [Clostridia bacterium]